MLHDATRLLRLAIGSALFLVTIAATSFSQTETVLYDFQLPGVGAVPFSGLIRDHAGNFYGTTDAGGANGRGNVFKLDGTDGAQPAYGTLLRDQAGNLYGTTQEGGSDIDSENGVVFKITP